MRDLISVLEEMQLTDSRAYLKALDLLGKDE